MWFENFFLAVRLLFHPRVKLLYKVLLGAGIVIYFLWPWDFISDIPVNLGWVCIWPLTYLDDFLIAYLLMILFINVCPAPIVAQMRAELLHKDPEIMTGLAFQHPGETRTLLWIMLALPITFS